MGISPGSRFILDELAPTVRAEEESLIRHCTGQTREGGEMGGGMDCSEEEATGKEWTGCVSYNGGAGRDSRATPRVCNAQRGVGG